MQRIFTVSLPLFCFHNNFARMLYHILLVLMWASGASYNTILAMGSEIFMPTASLILYILETLSKHFQFRHTEEGKRALEQLNGFELAGRSLRITAVDEEEDKPTAYAGYGYSSSSTGSTNTSTKPPRETLSSEEPTLSGQANRVQLMGKLAQSNNFFTLLFASILH